MIKMRNLYDKSASTFVVQVENVVSDIWISSDQFKFKFKFKDMFMA